MNEETKICIVIGSVLFGVVGIMFGIISTIEYSRINERCFYLEKHIEYLEEGNSNGNNN